jgi:hypothetical protein
VDNVPWHIATAVALEDLTAHHADISALELGVAERSREGGGHGEERGEEGEEVHG